jgi:hypothetical protein
LIVLIRSEDAERLFPRYVEVANFDLDFLVAEVLDVVDEQVVLHWISSISSATMGLSAGFGGCGFWLAVCSIACFFTV